MARLLADRINRTNLTVLTGRALSTVAPGFAGRCCFIHLPKCAGTAVGHALRALCPLTERVEVVYARPSRRAAAMAFAGVDSVDAVHEDGPRSEELFRLREAQMLYAMSLEAKLIIGHCLFSPAVARFFGDAYRFVTVLRDPVQRVLSNYVDARSAGFVTEPFEEYLEGDVARRHATVNLRYFSGRSEIPWDAGEEALATAVDNLRRFALIGFTDDMEAFEAGFRRRFGAGLRVRHHRPARGAKPELTPAARRRLEEICALDRRIHEAARAIRDQER
ncbi:hypothetical protein [Azospirillum sp. ST 5-10]|uniref:hypothetical protein n=1 Tax=unclassified Azospirillum TaxID=2630922 RepID=UPI003F4A5AD1